MQDVTSRRPAQAHPRLLVLTASLFSRKKRAANNCRAVSKVPDTVIRSLVGTLARGLSDSEPRFAASGPAEPLSLSFGSHGLALDRG